MMRGHRDAVLKRCADLTGPELVLFGLFIAERLRACCRVAHHDTAVWPAFSASLENAFYCIEVGQLDTFGGLIASLESLVPEGGEPLQVQGQSAVICLLESLRLFLEPCDVGIEAVINSVIDALDNYTFYSHLLVTGELDSPEMYPLLSRELDRQLGDLEFVAAHPSGEAVRRRRIENLQFAVPVAVGA